MLAFLPSLLPSLLLSVAAAVPVEGTANCPRPAEVAAHLRRLSPETGHDATAERARVDESGGVVHLQLLGASNAIIAERKLVQIPSCTELAEIAAVLILAWQGKLPEMPVNAGDRHLPAEVVRTSASGGSVAVAASPPTAPRFFPPDVDVAAGVLAGNGTHGILPGLSIESFARPRGWRLGLHLALWGTKPDSEDKLGGTISSTHVGLAIAPRVRLARRPWTLDAYAGIAPDLLMASGQDYATDHAGSIWSYAAVGGLRLARSFTRLAPWVGLGTVAYQRRSVVLAAADGRVGGEVVFPRWEVQLSAGISWGPRS